MKGLLQLVLALSASVAGGVAYQAWRPEMGLAPTGIANVHPDPGAEARTGTSHLPGRIAQRSRVPGFGSRKTGVEVPAAASPTALRLTAKTDASDDTTVGFSFSDPVFYPMSVGDASAVAIGDLNGDRRQDVVVTSEAGPGASFAFVYLQGSDGQLQAPIPFKYESAYGSRAPVAIGDVNGDGIGDIVIGHDGGITIALGGTTKFSPLEISAGLDFTELALVDLDLDGALDIVAQSWSQGAMFFYSDGFGSVRKIVSRDTLAAGYNDLKIGDVTGDALPDMVQTSAQSYNFRVYRHNGIDGFNTTRVYTWSDRWTPDGVAVGDFNGDGLNDVAMTGTLRDVSTGIQHGLRVFAGTAANELVDQGFRVLAGAPTQIASADFDNDGYADVALLENGSLRVLLQRTHRLDEERSVVLGNAIGFESTRLATGDVNGDGCIDVAVASISDGLVVVVGSECGTPARHMSDPLPPRLRPDGTE